MEPYIITKPEVVRFPIIISVPHSGTAFPPELQPHIHDSILRRPPDTDWYVDRLYKKAAQELGLIMIQARYSRYVVDLNRPTLMDQPLYGDGRKETSFVPQRTFEGEPLYKNKNSDPAFEGALSPESRISYFYMPYYNKISSELSAVKDQFGAALLWDAHSIKRRVPSIQSDPFPDLILGSYQEKSADLDIIQWALSQIRSGPYQVTHNTPFMGGQITRHFGKPADHIHALQLEMSQDLYLNETTGEWLPEAAEKFQEHIKNTLEKLGHFILKK